MLLLICLSASFLPRAIHGQQKVWRHYSTIDGLPSNAVYDILEASNGYLWFATEYGMCRFNGYEFQLPHDTSSRRGTSAFVPTEDKEGRIWFARIDATLWFIQKDTVHEWKYNDHIRKLPIKERIADQLAIGDDGTVWIALSGKGLLVIDPDGNLSHMRASDLSNFTFTNVRGKLIYATQTPVNASLTGNNVSIDEDIMRIQDDRQIQIVRQPYLKMQINFIRGIWNVDQGFILDQGGRYLFIRNDSVLWRVPSTIYAECMRQTPQGEILIASHQGNLTGLFHCPSLDDLRTGDYHLYLHDKLVSMVEVDAAGGWWVSTLNDGIYYCKNPEVEIYDQRSGLPSDDVMRLATDKHKYVYTGHRPAWIGQVNITSGDSKNLGYPQTSAKEVLVLYHDDVSKQLWYGPMLSQLNDIAGKGAMMWVDQQTRLHRPVPSKSLAYNAVSGLYYTSTHSGFYELDPVAQSLTHLGILDTSVSHDRTYDIAVDLEGTVWITTTDGLRIWRNNRYEPPPFTHPALSNLPQEIEFLADGTMAIGLAGSGLLIREPDGSTIVFTMVNGLTSDHLTTLRASSDHRFFGCTNAGLNILRKSAEGWKIERLTLKHGLPSNQVNDAVMVGEDIWVATDNGLAHVAQSATHDNMPRPVIEGILPHNQNRLDISHKRFRYDQNAITIQYYALHYRSDGDILYRYRLTQSNEEYTETKSRQVNFAQLRPGEYTFEVEAQNSNGVWSDTARWTFQIIPAWWQTWWMRGALIGIITLSVFWYYRQKLHDARKQHEFDKKMHDLENAALRAQMNPHFIFNCLNSIQDFIAANDSTAATTYLGKFAKLIRLALHSSVDGKHTIQEEVDMLESYLALEQLRFTNRFSYHIQIAADIDPQEIAIPPLLVQPFVENAVIHGMKNKLRGGHISVSFDMHEETLVATVTDNGPGLDARQEGKESSHKSVGMTLTQRRMEIIGESSEDYVTIRNIPGADNTAIGTLVQIRIPVNI